MPFLCSAFPGDVTPCMGKMGLLGEDWQNKPPGGAERKPGKNLYTNPGKNGGMGYSHKDRTIGGNPPEYVPDTYQHGRQLGKELRRQARARIPKAFNSSPNRGSGLFNPNPYNDPPGPDKAPVKKPNSVSKKAFVPSNPPKKGAAYEAISKVGRDYVPEPIREAEVCWKLQTIQRQLNHMLPRSFEIAWKGKNLTWPLCSTKADQRPRSCHSSHVLGSRRDYQ